MNTNRSRRIFWIAPMVLALVAACGDDTAPGTSSDAGTQLDTERTRDTGAPDVLDVSGSEDTAVSDSEVEEDAPSVDDGGVETDGMAENEMGEASDADASSDAVADATPDTGGDADVGGPDLPTCEGECLEVSYGPTPVELLLHDSSTAAPVLTGLAAESLAPLGEFDLTDVDIYRQGSFNEAIILSVSVSDNGDGTNGTAEFTEEVWGFFADIDVLLEIQPLVGGRTTQTLAQEITAGGCYVLLDTEIFADVEACSGGFPEGVTPPNRFEFEYDSGTGILILELVLTKAFVLAMIPAGTDRDLADVAITGALYIQLTYEAVVG
jgi:hypothetical protein